MKSALRVALLASLVCAACGGPEKPAASASDPPLPASPPETPPPAAKSDAPAPSAELAKGVKDFDAGKFKEAAADFAAALKKNPKDADAGFNLGQVEEKLGDAAAAAKAYADVLVVRPDFEQAAVALSALLVDQQDFDGAIATCRKALAKHPESAALNENLGVALASKGDAAGARKALEAATRIGAPNAQSLLTFGHWLAQWKSKDATPVLMRAAQAGGADVGVLASVGLELRLAGAFPECVRIFDQAVSLKDGGEVRTERALCKLGLKDDAGELSDLEAAVSVEPSFAAGHFFLANRFARSGKLKEGVAEYETYLKLAPTGSLAKPAAERLRAAKDALAHRK